MLLYHIAPGGPLGEDAIGGAGAVATALPGAAPLQATDSAWSGLQLRDATGVQAAVAADPAAVCGSAVYVLDRVLLPAGLLAIAETSPEAAAAALGGSSTSSSSPTGSAGSTDDAAAGDTSSAGGDAVTGDSTSGGATSSSTTSGEGSAALQVPPGFVPEGWDYLAFARQWGPAFCATAQCSKPT